MTCIWIIICLGSCCLLCCFCLINVILCSAFSRSTSPCVMLVIQHTEQSLCWAALIWNVFCKILDKLLYSRHIFKNLNGAGCDGCHFRTEACQETDHFKKATWPHACGSDLFSNASPHSAKQASVSNDLVTLWPQWHSNVSEQTVTSFWQHFQQCISRFSSVK